MFGLNPSSGPNLVKKYDKEVADGDARRKFKGKATSFNEDVARKIDAQFEADETATYAEAAAALGMPKTTLYDYATKDMDYRCLGHKVRPFPSDENRTKRVIMGKKIIYVKGPVLQFYSAGGHGMARGHGVYDDLAKMMNDNITSNSFSSQEIRQCTTYLI